MKTATCLAALIGTAAAFAPAQTGKSSTRSLAASFDDDMGRANEEVGMWDPLNLVDGDQDRFDRLRSVEIKHGRVAMLAFLGYATTWGNPYRFPGCADFPAGHEAVLKIPPLDLLLPILAVCGLLETSVFVQKEGSFPGDMSGGTPPVGFGPFAKTDEQKLRLRTQELLNGRAAQMGILGLMVHEQLNGKPFIFFDHIEPYTPFGNFI